MPNANAVPIVAQYGDAPADKVIIDITNPMKADARAKANVSAFIESPGLRPLHAGGLELAHWLEGTALLMVSLARHGVRDFNFSLGVNVLV